MFPGSPRARENIRVIPLTAAANIALMSDDPDLIYLEAITATMGGSTITLPNTAPLGKRFAFILASDPWNNPTLGSTEYVDILVPGYRAVTAQVKWRLFSGNRPEFIYGPNGWISTAIGGVLSGGANNNVDISIGNSATASYAGISIGSPSNSNSQGIAAGYNATGWSSGVGLGLNAKGSGTGTSLGPNSMCHNLSGGVALGCYAVAMRYREMIKSADITYPSLRSWSMVDWYGDTTTATATELFLGGTTAQYCILQNNSAVQFEMRIIGGVTGAGLTSAWSVSGVIKTGASVSTATLVGTPIVTLLGQDAGASGWGISVSADSSTTSLGYLKLIVTGAASTNIRWNATATLTEIRY